VADADAAGAAGDLRAGAAQAPHEPGLRGGLEIAGRVVERVAAIAASEVDGVVSSGSGLDHLLGHRYPKADAVVAGGRTRVQVDIAIAWPRSLAQVTADVRARVHDRVGELAGLMVDAVDVTASKIVPVGPHERSRVQ